mmetsp:Transcript_7613/g.18004  ORF Transcript_7613/g.18004 Transcript_7613/m.18004 type:complete len:391 (+) Transcript_7613:1110-2282(+)
MGHCRSKMQASLSKRFRRRQVSLSLDPICCSNLGRKRRHISLHDTLTNGLGQEVHLRSFLVALFGRRQQSHVCTRSRNTSLLDIVVRSGPSSNLTTWLKSLRACCYFAGTANSSVWSLVVQTFGSTCNYVFNVEGWLVFNIRCNLLLHLCAKGRFQLFVLQQKKRHKLCASELLLCNSNLSNTISQDFGAPSFRQLSLRCQQFRNPLVSLDSQQKLVSADESLLLLFIFKLSEQVAEVVVKRTVLIFILILEANTTPMHTCIPCFDRQVNANCRNWKMCTILKLSSKKWTAPSDPFRHVHAPLVIVTPSGNMQYHLHNFGARTWNKRLCPSHILWTVHQHIFQQSEQRARQFGGFCPRRRLKRMQSRFLNGIQCLLKQYQHNPPCKLKLT